MLFLLLCRYLLTFKEPRARIFKLLRSRRIDSKELFQPAYVTSRAGTTTLFLIGSYKAPNRLFKNSSSEIDYKESIPRLSSLAGRTNNLILTRFLFPILKFQRCLSFSLLSQPLAIPTPPPPIRPFLPLHISLAQPQFTMALHTGKCLGFQKEKFGSYYPSTGTRLTRGHTGVQLL
jgi:hypothetical protein